MKTYLYQGKEWKPTGRHAVKSHKRNKEKDVTLIEIHPLEIDDDDKSFDKWVDHIDLYHVKNVGDAEELNEDEDDE